MFGRSYRGSDEMNIPTWLDGATTELKFCLLPRECELSKKSIWLKLAYRSRRRFRSGDTDFITEDRWYNKHEFLIMRLKYGV